MRRFALVVALSTMLVQGADACEGQTCGDDGYVSGTPVSGSQPLAPPCPEPPCTNATTTGDFGFSPFTRITTGPAHNVGCFAVAKKNDSSYTIFINVGDTFEKSWSADGVTGWSARRPCYGLTSGPEVRCPDPRFTGGSQMEMYYNLKMGTQFGVARATSSDNGVNWVMNPTPVVTPTATHYPYMPSVVEYNGKLLLSYAWVCIGSVTTMADIHVLESTDGGTSWTTLTNNAISEGGCFDWDNGSVNRPRLVAAPSENALYMFWVFRELCG
jgi:hypothetical protein